MRPITIGVSLSVSGKNENTVKPAQNHSKLKTRLLLLLLLLLEEEEEEEEA
jgi:hypothetical protein